RRCGVEETHRRAEAESAPLQAECDDEACRRRADGAGQHPFGMADEAEFGRCRGIERGASPPRELREGSLRALAAEIACRDIGKLGNADRAMPRPAAGMALA